MVDNLTVMARQLRLAIVRNVFMQGLLSEDQAQNLLSGPLEPGNDQTIWDDSHLLHAEDALERIRESSDAE